MWQWRGNVGVEEWSEGEMRWWRGGSEGGMWQWRGIKVRNVAVKGEQRGDAVVVQGSEGGMQ